MILEGIERIGSRPTRMLLNQAEDYIAALTSSLSTIPGVVSIEPAGSFRRKKETIGDLDLLAETTDPAGLMERFTGLGAVDTVIGRGGHKSAVRLLRGPQVDLMVMSPGTAGTYRIHFTGSKEHNVRLRARARDRGWSLSEYGFQKIGEDGEPITGADAELRTFASEAEAYAFLDLPFIEPELREDEGEIEAALAGTLPTLITEGDLRGDCHTHSEWSDGSQPIEVMAEACRRGGYAFQVLTDHTQSLAIASGLAPDRVEEERAIIAELNARYAAEEAAGTAPPETPKEGFRLLHGCELEVRADGVLDYEDDLLARFDVVVASVHVARRQSRADLDAADPQCDPQPPRRHHRPPLRPDDPDARRSGPRLGGGLRRRGADRHCPGDQRLAAPPGPVGGACPPSGLGRLRPDGRFGCASHARARLRALGHHPGTPGVGTAADVMNTRSRAEVLAWAAAKPTRVSA